MNTPALLRPPAPPATVNRLDLVRVTGVLEHDAELRMSVGGEPHAFLLLQIAPPRGLRYHVQQDVGTDPADHMHARARLHALRRGALVTVTGTWLRPRRDHGHEVLVIEGCRGVITHVNAAEANALANEENPACNS